MNDIIDLVDTLDAAQHQELTWARLLIGEIALEADALQCEAEKGKVEECKFRYMQERHLHKMNMVCGMLLTVDEALEKAQAMANAQRNKPTSI